MTHFELDKRLEAISIDEAIYQERERCAKIAEALDKASDCYYCNIGQDIAAAIRKGE